MWLFPNRLLNKYRRRRDVREFKARCSIQVAPEDHNLAKEVFCTSALNHPHWQGLSRRQILEYLDRHSW
jgi:hypothetical protein